MRIVVKGMDLTMAGSADLNGGTRINPLAFGLLTGNQVMFCESGHLSIAEFAELRHLLERSG